MTEQANLCFRCGDKWEPGHKCKVGFHMMKDDKEEVLKMGNEGELDVIKELDSGDEELMVMKVDLSLFLMAVDSGNAALKLFGHIAYRRVTVLVDSGANSSFVS